MFRKKQRFFSVRRQKNSLSAAGVFRARLARDHPQPGSLSAVVWDISLETKLRRQPPLDPPARHRHDRSSKHRDRRRASPSAVASRRVASSRRRRRPDAPESPDRRVTNGRIARKSRNAVLYFFRREVTPKALKRERDRAARESVFSRRAVSVNARSVARKRRLILSHTARRNSNLSTWVACTRPGRACPAPPCPTSARRRAG